jgi:hypothetical protein
MQWLHSSELGDGGQYGKLKNSPNNGCVYTFVNYKEMKILK